MIKANHISLMRGGKTLLSDTSFTIFPQHRIGLIGKNGCGKSSLFALFRDELQLEEGELQLPSEWRIASVAQETPALSRSAIDYVMDGDQSFRVAEQALQTAEAEGDGHAIAHSHEQLAQLGAYDIRSRAAMLLDGLGFLPEQIEQPVSAFSGGWRMRLNLAQALIAPSDLMLLDEPTNHLDVDAIFWLESWLKSYSGTLVIISHDRDFLDNVATDILHVENQVISSYTGNYSQFEHQRAEHLMQQQSEYEKAQAIKKHMQAYVDRFRYKASKAKQAQSRLKAIEKLSVQAPLQAERGIDFEFLPPAKLPNPLINMREVKAGYGDTVILENIKLNLVPGTRMGLLGRNGAGKSTLIKTLSGSLEPLAGERTVSQGVSVGYFAQHQLEALDPDASPLLHLQRLDSQATEQQLRDFIGGFGFSGDQALAPVEPMSGGEKARLALALIIYQKPNLLLLDEPTNHLDIGLRDALVNALQAFEGALIVVSHDRHLLRTTVDEFYRVHEGHVEPFPGDLDQYHAWLEQQAKQRREKSTTTATPGKEVKVDRKEQKRREAEFRKATKPLRDRIAQSEQQLEKIADALEVVHQGLSDSSIYDTDKKDALNKLLAEQRRLQAEQETLEERWMEAEGTLAEMTEQFEQEADS
ncbi:ATP-binding cassette domain-containing protein [Idiomarina sp. UBA3162]|uniref:ATP-binding cassette domain-containing protein n=1 Tax=unclassified Idiomarina TaxID=2614829 RepID=UPI0025BA8CB7|nr:ATP-binding cassette domain-containing protein [Idiomarina sp. UBA3162]